MALPRNAIHGHLPSLLWATVYVEPVRKDPLPVLWLSLTVWPVQSFPLRACPLKVRAARGVRTVFGSWPGGHPSLTVATQSRRIA